MGSCHFEMGVKKNKCSHHFKKKCLKKQKGPGLCWTWDGGIWCPVRQGSLFTSFQLLGWKVLFVCFLLASDPIIQVLVLAPYLGKLWLSSADGMFSSDWKLCPSTPSTSVKHCGVLHYHGAFFLWMEIPFPWVLSEALSSSQPGFPDTNVSIDCIKGEIDKGEWRREREKRSK